MIKAGNLTFETYPIAFFPDWRKTRQFAWANLQMQFVHVATYDCRPPQTLPTLPNKLKISPHIMTTARTPLGRPDKQAFDARMRRFIGASGFKTNKEFVASIGKHFPDPKAKIDVPTTELLSRIDKNYRQVIGYWRDDRFILMVPRGRNPKGDFMILCLPDRISWAIYTVGICGTETKKKRLWGGWGRKPEYDYFFDSPGPYKKISPPRYTPGTPFRLEGGQKEHDVPEKEKNDFWRELEKKDRMQRKKASETGKPAGMDDRWLQEVPFDERPLEWQRHDAEMKRLSETYG